MKNPTTSNIVLAIVCTLTIIFTIVMIAEFDTHGSIPDTLVTCWFGTIAGECGVLGWIKTAKVKHVEYEREKAAYEQLMADREMRERNESNDS